MSSLLYQLPWEHRYDEVHRTQCAKFAEASKSIAENLLDLSPARSWYISPGLRKLIADISRIVSACHHRQLKRLIPREQEGR